MQPAAALKVATSSRVMPTSTLSSPEVNPIARNFPLGEKASVCPESRSNMRMRSSRFSA